VRVQFFITENDYLRLARANVGNSEAPQALKLILSDGSVFDQPGYLDFVDREVDAATGAILLQATFPNPTRLIRPGQFARVRAVVRQVNQGLLVPQRAVVEFQGRFHVLLVGHDNKVMQKPVELVSPYRDYYLIKGGLKAGDHVILEGIQKVKEGILVQPEPVQFESQYPAS
jgi:membrane fusion protein (multidrug efflux system)